ncbi:hypothetical protein DSS3P8_033 [Roseobacter phage DSS3P8]|nr:hypothetical protein DSS3P8_033 [Roseobacter phage DSS3P8]
MAENFFNAATQIVTIYSPAGEAHSCTRLNALDLIRTNGYKWNSGDAPAKAAEPTPEDSVPEVVTETHAEAEVVIDEEPFDVNTAPLADVAERIVGSNDIAKYLEGFTADALRVMADERFGQKVHHKASKASVIDKIIMWEEGKTADESEEV